MKFGNFSGMNNSLCGGVSGQSSVYAPVAGRLWSPSTWHLKGGISGAGTFGGGVSETTPEAIWWNAAGTKVFFSGVVSGQLKSYDVNAAFDLQTINFANSRTSPTLKAVDGVTTVFPCGLALSANGLNLFTIDRTLNKLFKHTLGTAFSPATLVATAAQESVVNFGGNTGPNGLSFIETGGACKFMFVNAVASPVVQTQTMNAAFDLTTLAIQQSQVSPVANPYGCCWIDSGNKFAVLYHTNGTVRCYTTPTPYNIDVMTATSHYDTINLTQFGYALSAFTDIQFNTAGTRMYLTDHLSDRMIQFGMT
jgi:hypothetical protein